MQALVAVGPYMIDSRELRGPSVSRKRSRRQRGFSPITTDSVSLLNVGEVGTKLAFADAVPADFDAVQMNDGNVVLVGLVPAFLAGSGDIDVF